MNRTQRNGTRRRLQSRQRRAYQLGRNAVLAVKMIGRGWPTPLAARVCGVNHNYLWLARKLDPADLKRLNRGEITLAQLQKQYQRSLAEQRAEQRAERETEQRHAEEIAALKAEREEIEAGIQRVFNAVDPADLIDAFLDRFGGDVVLRSLDRLTRPQLPLVAAE